MGTTTNTSHVMTGCLDDRGVVRIAGADALVFLDRMVTNDLDGMAPGEARFAGLLSPQGKVLFEFIVVRPSRDDGLLLDAARAHVADLVKRLSLYKLRSKVEIEDASQAVAVAVGVRSLDTFSDPRHQSLPQRALVPPDNLAAAAGTNAYTASRIAARVPELGRDYLPGDLVAHEAMLDKLHGVSFTKGCYVGQEIVARMEHRGTARKRFVRITADTALPPPGAEIRAGDALIGQMGSSARVNDGRHAGLALLRLDRLAEFEARGVPLETGGVAIRADGGDVAELMPEAPDPVARD